MRKVYRVFFILLIFIILFSISYEVNASDIWRTASLFLEEGSRDIGTFQEGTRLRALIDDNAGKAKLSELIDFLYGIGLLVLFISTIIMGIRYMFVIPEEKSRIKKAVPPYIIGAIIIFGALTIWKFIIMILDGSL